MKQKSAFSIITFLAGLGMLVAAFFVWKGETPDNVFLLNLAVSVVVYGFLFLDLLTPWVDLGDRAQRHIGTLGLRWVVTGLYTILAVGAMLLFRFVWQAEFDLQLMIQLLLLFLTCCGFVMAFNVSDKVADVYEKECGDRNGIKRMKAAMAGVQDALAENPNVSKENQDKISEVIDALRYISPSGSVEAEESEAGFVKTAKELESAIKAQALNPDKIDTLTRRLTREILNRKKIY